MQVEMSCFQLKTLNSGEYRSCSIAYYDFSTFIHNFHWEQKQNNQFKNDLSYLLFYHYTLENILLYN